MLLAGSNNVFSYIHWAIKSKVHVTLNHVDFIANSEKGMGCWWSQIVYNCVAKAKCLIFDEIMAFQLGFIEE